uniref:NADH-ubiquinone oxidoreductase chain 3 n=1 Tax=Aulacophora indica TaxID=217245 RepID=A0A411D9W9_9CUCU|nr:NADH dehydrogenase subunit 3 [Aulacophora indica]QAY81970.1 NADH dehydrogenase subunit 3 [Aulacophora indica]QJA26354.1 NADH dehydrogenase subunit 3 [Aulacophora indica]QRI59119.1 NADH dehydrogenase subunit 3 [Aulacophora indica]
MKILFTLIIMIYLIMMLLIILLNLISKKTFYDREKSSPFECGFDPKNNARLPFSLHFFLIAIIFLIFDVEITLLLPLIITMKMSNLMNYSFIMTFFILILLIGLYHEWNQGSLNWTH